MATLATLNVSLLLDASQFQAELATQATKLQAFGTNVRNIGKGISSAGRSLTMGLTLPLVGLGAAGFKASADYEETLSQIVGLTGDTVENVQGMGDRLLQIGDDLGKTPQELVQGLYFVESSGIPASETMRTLEVSAMAASAGLGDTETVANAVTSAMMAYGPASLSASQATDILVGAVKEGKAEASSIAPVLGNVVGLASNMGISFDQVAASIAAMTNTGQDAATSATSLQAIMSSFAKPTTQQVDAVKKLGTTYGDLRQEIKEKGLLATLVDLKDKSGGNIDAMAELFPNVRALRGVLALTGENAGTNAEIFNNLANSTGNLDSAFQQATTTTKFRMNAALAQGQSVLIEVGNAVRTAVLPFIEQLTDGLKSLGDWFMSLTPAQQRMILLMAGIAAAIGPVLIVVGGLVSAIGTIIGVVGAALPIVGALLGVLTGPIGLVILAVGLLAAAWATNFGGIRDLLTAFWNNTLQPLVAKLVTWFQTTIPIALQALSDFWNTILMPALAQLDVWLRVNIPVALQALAGFWTGVLQPALQAVWGFISGSILPLLGALVDVGLAVVKVEVKALAGLWQNVLWPALQSVWSFIQANIIPVLQSVADTVSKVLGPPLQWLGDVVLAGLVTTFNNVRDAIQWVVDRLRELKTAIENLTLPDWLTPGSPTPFEMGLRGIASALSDMNRIGLPAFNAQLAGLPAMAPASVGPSVRHGDISISVTGVPMDEAEIGRQVRFARLLESG